MPLTIRPADPQNRPEFFGEVSGIDLRQPLTPARSRAIEAGMDRYARAGLPRPADRRRAAARVQPPFRPAGAGDRRYRAGRGPAAARWRSTTSPTSTRTARSWRATTAGGCSPRQHALALATVRSSRRRPSIRCCRRGCIPAGSGGNTEFADMRAAWDALDDDDAGRDRATWSASTASSIRAASSASPTSPTEERGEVRAGAAAPGAPPPGHRPAVALSRRPMPAPSSGWPVPEARALLRDLTEHATQRQFVYAHDWRPHDLVMWDNRVTMHRARRYDPADRCATCTAPPSPTTAPTLQQAA